jgi:hypothetical protein
MPEAAHHQVARFCRDAGESFPLRQDRTYKDLVKEGLAEGEHEHNTRAARVGGKLRRVVSLDLAKIEALLGVPFTVPEAGPVSPSDDLYM